MRLEDRRARPWRIIVLFIVERKGPINGYSCSRSGILCMTMPIKFALPLPLCLSLCVSSSWCRCVDVDDVNLLLEDFVLSSPAKCSKSRQKCI